MKRLGTALVFLLASGVAYAQQPSSDPKAGAGMQSDTKGKKEIHAQVVSTDAMAKTITFKKQASATAAADAKEMTLPVEAMAESSLKTVSAGDHVTLVCMTDSSGKQVVSKIERADTRPASDAPPKP
jgi:hypothetical protein